MSIEIKMKGDTVSTNISSYDYCMAWLVFGAPKSCYTCKHLFNDYCTKYNADIPTEYADNINNDCPSVELESEIPF